MTFLKKSHGIKILLLFFILIFLYTIFVFNKLADYSKDLKSDFDEKLLKGKHVNELVKLYGEPAKADCNSDLLYNRTLTTFEAHDPYCKLIYYTDNSFLNSIGWFPGGGTKIYVDKNGKMTRFKQYLE